MGATEGVLGTGVAALPVGVSSFVMSRSHMVLAYRNLLLISFEQPYFSILESL